MYVEQLSAMEAMAVDSNLVVMMMMMITHRGELMNKMPCLVASPACIHPRMMTMTPVGL
jgi:hypothetical protein